MWVNYQGLGTILTEALEPEEDRPGQWEVIKWYCMVYHQDPQGEDSLGSFSCCLRWEARLG